MRPLVVALVVTLVAGCPTDRRGEDEESSDPVAILLVLDDSNSMSAVHEALQDQFGVLIAGLDDARAAWRIGVTTTDFVDDGNGRRGGIRSRSAVGGDGCDPAYAASIDDNPGLAYRDLVNVGAAGSGEEVGLLAAVWALCKAQDEDFWEALPERPAGDPVRVFCEAIDEDQRACNRGFLFDGGDVGILIVTDEGDASDPLASSAAADYVTALDELGSDVTLSVVGPTYRDPDDPLDCDGTPLDLSGPCNAFGSTAASIDRYQQVACGAVGTYSGVQVTSAGDPALCVPADYEQALAAFADTLF